MAEIVPKNEVLKALRQAGKWLIVTFTKFKISERRREGSNVTVKARPKLEED